MIGGVFSGSMKVVVVPWLDRQVHSRCLPPWIRDTAALLLLDMLGNSYAQPELYNLRHLPQWQCTMATSTVATIVTLRELHPSSPHDAPDWLIEFELDGESVLDRGCFAHALLRNPHSSLRGPSELVFEHLRDLLDPTDLASGFEALFRLARHTPRGGVPLSVPRILGASRHVALAQSTWGLRPIAIGEVCLHTFRPRSYFLFRFHVVKRLDF